MIKRSILFSLFFCISQFCIAQTARFYADTVQLKKHTGSRSDLDHVFEMEWIINGQHMQWGSDTLRITPDQNKMDTVLFRADKRAKWDTILCNISKPEVYTFVYNTCCGGFYLRNERMKAFAPGKVSFRISGKPKAKYLGVIDEAGVPLRSDSAVVLNAMCRSAMSSNIFRVELQTMEDAPDTINCSSLMCLDVGLGNEPRYDFYYKKKKTLTSFLYMPMDETPLELIYDPKKRSTTLR